MNEDSTNNKIFSSKSSSSSKNSSSSSAAASTSRMAYPLHVKALERHLDLNPFIDQLEQMFSKPLDIPTDSSLMKNGQSSSSSSLDLSVKNLWPDEATRKKDLSEFYNFKTVGKRKWLKNLLLENSDSESDEQITDADIKILLKIHKYRRKYQKRYHTDIMNSQYTYYAAGLLSEYDFHPEHQQYILEQYGFMMPEVPAPTISQAPPQSAPAVPACPKKPDTSKKRKSIAGSMVTATTTAPNCAASFAPKRRDSAKCINSNVISGIINNSSSNDISSGAMISDSAGGATLSAVSAPAKPQSSSAFYDPTISSSAAAAVIAATISHHQPPPTKKCKLAKIPSVSVAVPFTVGAASHETSVKFHERRGAASCSSSINDPNFRAQQTSYFYNAEPPSQTFHHYQPTAAKFHQTLAPPAVNAKPAHHSQPSKREEFKQQQIVVEEPPVGPDATFRAIWKTIVNEILPKAYNEKHIKKTYRNVVLRDHAHSCALFLQQAKAGTLPGKTKNRHKKHKNELLALRPVMPPMPKPPLPPPPPPAPSTSSSYPHQPLVFQHMLNM